MKQQTVGVVDYGAGNQASLIQALRGIGYLPKATADIKELRAMDVIVLPGVGAFPSAMDVLRRRGLADFLLDWAACGGPVVGICLGMQLLTRGSTELGGAEGLGIWGGETIKLRAANWNIGWNYVQVTEEARQFSPELPQCIQSPFYFNHSYEVVGLGQEEICVLPIQPSVTSIACSGSVIGVQFHPEKSQEGGKRLLAWALHRVVNV